MPVQKSLETYCMHHVHIYIYVCVCECVCVCVCVNDSLKTIKLEGKN